MEVGNSSVCVCVCWGVIVRNGKQACSAGHRGPGKKWQKLMMKWRGRQGSFREALGYLTKVFIPYPLGMMDFETVIICLYPKAIFL